MPGISIPITADGDGFDEELRRVVIDAMKDVQRELDMTPLNVKIGGNFDSVKFSRELEAELEQIERTLDPEVRIGAKFDDAGLKQDVETAIAGAGGSVKIKADFDLDATALAELQAIQGMADKTITAKVDFDVDTTELAGLQSIQGMTDKTIRAKVDFDVDAAGLADMQAVAAMVDKTVKAKVDFDVDASALAELQAVQGMADKTINTKVEFDIDATGLANLQAIQSMADKTINTKVVFDIDASGLASLQALQSLADKTINFKVNFDIDAAALAAASSLAQLTDKDVTIRVRIDADEAQLARIAALLQALQSQTSTFRFSSNAETEATRIDRLRDSLQSVGIGAGGIVAVTAALGALTGAAGLAAGAIGGLAIAGMALGPAIAAAVGTATIALSGVKDAFDAAAEAAKNGPEEAASQAKAVASAQLSLQSAADGAASAQRTLADAQKDAKSAADAIGEAYSDAADDLEDLQFKLRGSVIDQKEAAIALKEAQADVFSAKTVDERQKALVRVERAQLNYDKAIEAGKDVAEEVNEAQEKGIENSDRVVAAKEAAADAEQRVADAAKASERAQQQVTIAQMALAEAQSNGGASAKKFAEAMEELSPHAQAFVLAGRELAPAWDEVKDSIQDDFFDGLDETFTNLANTVMPSLETGLGGIATEMNAGAKGFADFLTSAEGMAGLDATFASTEGFMRGMREGSDGFLAGMSQMMQAFAPLSESLGKAFGSIGSALGEAFEHIAQSGLLEEIVNGLSAALEALGPSLGSIMVGLAEMASAVLPALGPLFTAIGDMIGSLGPSLGEIGKVFAESLTMIMPSLGSFIKALAEGLQPVLPVIAHLFTVILDALQPMIEPLSQVAQVVGLALADAITAIAPSLPALAQAFADIVTAVSPLIPLFADSLSTVLQALAPAISEIAVALAPVIAQFAEQMSPVIQEIAPILADVAKTIGLALADAIKQLAPMLPGIVTAFTNLLMAILPLLPELVKLAADLLPPLLNILVELSPVLIKLMEAFTWLVQDVLIPYVLPIIREVADQFKWAMEKIGEAIDWVKDTLFPALGTAIDKVKGWFETGVDGITKAWDKIKEAAAVPVRFIVNTVWNEGLLKAWNAVQEFIPGMAPMEKVTLGFARGGGVNGPGTGTSDSILAYLSNGEHVVTAAEVLKAGGQNILYAIRDMIARGIPFTWDNGRIISQLGRDNLSAYGSAVRDRGIGNVPPEGLFDQLMPRYRTGGAVFVEPWMQQLARGHEFARAQHGRPYQWAGPRWRGDSFDCSGFMGSIAAAILGLNPWQRYWATSSFGRGQRATGPQGFVAGVGPGFTIGVTDDPGGPGGGHTAGVLGEVPGLFAVARVESGGARGDVHYNDGPDPRSFLTQYHLPIGANGFFQPGTGSGVGPSVGEQRGFVERMVLDTIRKFTSPIRDTLLSAVGAPPPRWREVPPAYLTTVEDKVAGHLTGMVGGLGDLLPGAWSKAREFAGNVFDALNPFDSGGVASGVGFMPKNVIAPERVLSPEQTRLFESLVVSLQQVASGTGPGPEPLTATVFQQGIDHLARVLGVEEDTSVAPEFAQQMEQNRQVVDVTGRVLGTVQDLADRSESSTDRVLAEGFEQVQAVLASLGIRLSEGVLLPIMQSAVQQGIGLVERWVEGSADQITASTDGTTAAVQALDVGVDPALAPAPFGAPGSAFDAVTAISDAVVSVAQTAQQAFMSVANDIANAALAQQASRVDNPRGVLGRDISGGPLVDMIVRLTGVEIEIRDTLVDTWQEIRDFRGDLVNAFDVSGRIVADTADLMQRNESSRDLVISEQNRLNRELIKAVLRYLMTSVLIPILSAILGIMIQVAVTAIGAAIGSVIPGIGTAIGAAVGAVVGAALAGVAAVFVSTLAVGAGAAIDAFDSGGVAYGKGLMVKDTIAPERVLSPSQTESFDRLVAALEKSGNRTVNVPMTVYESPGGGRRIGTDLLSLL
ncbi:hypothetical protein [Nocardia farcinica]|uniref:phage tail protein n=1 Tax=Nocardia farcinica TaxID=37329 RepID=UPI003D78C235